MSEYQYYEFLAIDHPLTAKDLSKVQQLSSRARITATSFTNEYQWGDFRGNPDRLMETYYDAHLYLANWGTRRVMLRLPETCLDVATAAKFCTEDSASAKASNGFTVLDFTSDLDDPSYDIDIDENGQGLLSSIVGIRSELAAGDLRPLYLAWLASYSNFGFDAEPFEGELEPPLPAGLASLSAAQRALADFLRVDEDLLAVAASSSPAVNGATEDSRAVSSWLGSLSAAEKDRFLLRIMQGETSGVVAELKRQFSNQAAPAASTPVRRGVAELFELAEQHRDERDLIAAAARERAATWREQKRAEAQQQRLDALAAEGDKAWARVETLIDARKAAEYDIAVNTLRDLKKLAEREIALDQFRPRLMALRKAHARKVSMIERLDKAGL